MPKDHSRPTVVRCLNCRYILNGVAARVCPECGRPFDPSNPDSYDVASPPLVPPGVAFPIYSALYMVAIGHAILAALYVLVAAAVAVDHRPRGLLGFIAIVVVTHLLIAFITCHVAKAGLSRTRWITGVPYRRAAVPTATP